MAMPKPPSIAKAIWPKLSSPVYPKCTLMPMASRAKKIAWKPKNALPATWNASMRSDIGSADPSPGAQDALGPDDEDDDQQEQASDVLDVTRDDQGGHLHEHADDEAADQGAVGRAQTTEGDP